MRASARVSADLAEPFEDTGHLGSKVLGHCSLSALFRSAGSPLMLCMMFSIPRLDRRLDPKEILLSAGCFLTCRRLVMQSAN